MKHLKLLLAVLLLACIAIPVLVACTTPGNGTQGGTEALPETEPLVYGEVLTDKTEFKLVSADSSMELALKDNALFITSLATKAAGENRAAGEDSAFPLPFQYGTGGKYKRFEWTYVGYMNYLPEDAKNGQYGYLFRFKDDTVKVEYDLVVTAHSKFAGPFEFTGYLRNNGSDIEYLPGAYFSTTVIGEKTPTVWTFNKESGLAEGFTDYDGRRYNGSGIYKKLLNSKVTISYNTFQNHNQNGQIPMQYVDYGTHGFYCAHEWTNGQITASKGESSGSCTFEVKLGDSKDFQTTAPANSTIFMPTVYLGVYDGTVDEGSNVFKRWFLNNKAPEVLLENKDEPLVQQDMQSGLGSASYGIQAVKWDYGWWSNESVGDWKTNEGLLEINNTAYLDVMKSYGAKDLATFVKKATQNKLTLTVYILTKDTGLDREGVPTSVGKNGHPEWFSNRVVTVGKSADFGNVECVEFFKTYLLNFFKETGVTTWRSDFEPICYQSDKANRHDANGSDVQYWCSVGFYDLVDYLYDNLETFRYESCSSGGAMKDFSTMRRAVILNCDDSANFQSLKMSFYDSSYCIHPAQLQLPVNAGTYTEGTQYYVGYGDHTYGMRSQLLGAVMLSNWDGTQPEDKVAWVKQLKPYNSKIKPLMKNGDLYHVLARPDGKNWDGVFYVDADAEASTKGLLAVFKPSKSGGSQKNIKLKGLNAETTYNVVFQDHKDQNYTATGAELMETGVKVSLTGDYDCDWVWIEEPEAS